MLPMSVLLGKLALTVLQNFEEETIVKRKSWIWMTVLAGALIWLGGSSAMAAADTKLDVRTEAQVAGSLGLLLGDGQGLTDEYLQKKTVRMQAAIMMLRVSGLEKAALAYTGKDNFADSALVSESEQAILAYIKANPKLGWTGTDGGKFDPLAEITPQQFYKVLLEALGYKAGADFSYADTLAFAKSKGLFRAAASETLRNQDIATASIEALGVSLNGQSATLGQTLAKLGVIPENALSALSANRLNIAVNEKVGSYLVDGEGRTLYYFTKDAADLNACQKGCLQAWPIYDSEQLLIPSSLNASDFGRFERSDGTTQLTYKGWPVYYFAKDPNPGDVNGEDFNHVWYVFRTSNYAVTIGTSAALGNYLADAEGRTLYYFDKDTKGTSACAGPCIELWPAFYAESIVAPTGFDAADFGTITRADGSLQTTYKGFPLYYYTPDEKRGDMKGQAFKDVWYVIEPGKFDGTKAQKAADGAK